MARQWQRGRRAQQGAWALALAVGAVGAAAYLALVLTGDNPWLFRVYYLGGALLTAPLLGLGSAYLLPNPLWPRIYLGICAAGGLLGAGALAGTPLDRAALRHIGYGPGTSVVHGGLFLTCLIVLNTLGAVSVIGVALWSIYRSALRHAPWAYVGGNAMIAIGTLVIAAAGGLARLGDGAGFWGAMAVGWVIVYGGFAAMAAYRPAVRRAEAPT